MKRGAISKGKESFGELWKLKMQFSRTSSQPRERVDSTIFCDANELLNTDLFADCCNLFV